GGSAPAGVAVSLPYPGEAWGPPFPIRPGADPTRVPAHGRTTGRSGARAESARSPGSLPRVTCSAWFGRELAPRRLCEDGRLSGGPERRVVRPCGGPWAPGRVTRPTPPGVGVGRGGGFTPSTPGEGWGPPFPRRPGADPRGP